MWNNILFDLDGTLIDSGAGVTASVQYALEAMGRPLPDAEQLRRFIGPPLQKSFADFCGMSGAEIETAIQKYREHYSEIGVNQNEVYPGIPQLLQRLHGQGKALYVATSKPTVYAAKILADLGLAAYFRDIAGSGIGRVDEGKAEIITRILAQHQLSPGATVMVGDRYFDIEGAHATGLYSIGILFGGYGSRQELADAGAGAIADDVPALEHLLAG